MSTGLSQRPKIYCPSCQRVLPPDQMEQHRLPNGLCAVAGEILARLIRSILADVPLTQLAIQARTTSYAWVRLLNIGPREVNSVLREMEEQGVVARFPGALYRLAGSLERARSAPVGDLVAGM